MGTTLVTALFYDNTLTIAHVGDSRLYQYSAKERKLSQLTVDHTILQEFIDRGVYTKEEALTSTNKNLVTRALGVDQHVNVDITMGSVEPDDVFLLCSDGLHDLVSHEAIELTISTFKHNLNAAAASLVHQANDAGGYDNSSVVLIRCLKPFPAEKRWHQKISSWFKN